MHASYQIIIQVLRLAYTIQACILNLKVYAMQASIWICTYQMQSIKVHELAPLLVCFSCPRILIHLFSSMLLLLCPCPTSISFISHLSHCTISPPFNQAISLYNLFPFVINFHKRCASHWCKGMHLGRWLRLESCIFYGHHLIVGMTPLEDTTCNLYLLYLV